MHIKGIILAGGAGTRLYPMTSVASKQLQPVYDKPMIYYPLSTLMLAGVREVLLISTPVDLPRFRRLLGDGRTWGISIEYCVQPEPAGIAQAFLLADAFLDGAAAILILGDNVFYGKMRLNEIVRDFGGGGCIFGYPVGDPERYGVVEFDRDGRVLSIEEKPEHPKSHYAVPGLYIYGEDVVLMARSLRPSARGELEITDLNRLYLDQGRLRVIRLGRGIAWLDTGTPVSLLEASQFIYTIEARQGLKIACPEEIAFRLGYITAAEFAELIDRLPQCDYAEYLRRVLEEAD
ncbi:MAG: glucose-1-phosphate thymidylyltransferase RfbA [Kiritimatiellaeota bacterium]|nr:glucose-1-phosphate thymidylyltransferase RfbA [Kiritimatiellota bacterium]